MAHNTAGVRVERIDRIAIRLDGKVKRDERGYARVWGRIIHANALLPYGRADGVDADEQIEFVPESTVNDAEAIASLIFAPVTMPHPPEMLDATNTSRHQIGTIVDAKFRDGALWADHLFTDASALDRIDGGIVELSPGYTAEVEETPGKFDGASYHAIQRNRRYNHNAVIPEARGGRGSRLFVDGKRPASGLRIQTRNDQEEIDTMAMVTIDGTEFEVPDEVAEEMARMRGNEDSGDEPTNTADAEDDEEVIADAPGALPEPSSGAGSSGSSSTTISVTTGKKDGFQALLGRLDGIEDRVASRLETRQKTREDAASKARSDAKSTYEEAKAALSRSYKWDGKSEAQIMRDAVVARNPDLKAKADASIGDVARLRGMFDSEMCRKPVEEHHAFGDDVKREDSGDTWTKRVDAASAAHRKYRVIGTEAVCHESVTSIGAN